jgi:hypothetical protein
MQHSPASGSLPGHGNLYRLPLLVSTDLQVRLLVWSMPASCKGGLKHAAGLLTVCASVAHLRAEIVACVCQELLDTLRTTKTRT